MTLDLETRSGLPDALRILAETLPRSGWEAHPNFDEMTRFWLQRHAMFREVIGRLQAGTAAHLDGQSEAEDHASETVRYGGFLLNELHTHHHVEDEHYFPRLMDLDPRLRHGFDLLASDHHALDANIHAMADRINAMTAALTQPGGRDRAAALMGALDRFGGLLHRHLEDEEDLIVPVILTHAPAL